jgi:DNA-binding CsgD family transcriptional regulator
MSDQHWTPWTPRETEIVRLTAEGLTAQQIARRLVLAPKTVENHIWRAKQKVDCPNRAALVAYAVTHGITDPPTEPIRVFRDPDGDRADAELDRLIHELDHGVVTDHLDADDVLDIAPEPTEPEEADEEPRRPRGSIVAIVLVLLALAGVGAYAFVHTPDAPAAVPAAPALETTTSPASAASTSSPAPPSGKRKSRTATVDPTFDELRTAAKRAHDAAGN